MLSGKSLGCVRMSSFARTPVRCSRVGEDASIAWVLAITRCTKAMRVGGMMSIILGLRTVAQKHVHYLSGALRPQTWISLHIIPAAKASINCETGALNSHRFGHICRDESASLPKASMVQVFHSSSRRTRLFGHSLSTLQTVKDGKLAALGECRFNDGEARCSE